jgi:hypothetical protein
MSKTFRIIYKNKVLAMSYLSPHPEFANHNVVSVVPVTRKGKWDDNSLEIRIESPLHDILSSSTADIDAVKEVLSQAAIEPWKVEIIPTTSA